MAWVLLIVGLIFLLIYLPIGIVLLILSAIAFATRGRKISKGITPKGKKVCPKCAEVIQGQAKICRYCGADVVDIPGVGAPPAETKIETTQTPQGPLKMCPRCEAKVAFASLECPLCKYKF